MSQRRSLLIIVLVVAVGCASGGGSEPWAGRSGASDPVSLEQFDGALYVNTPSTGTIMAIELPGTPREIFPHVAKVYEELGIPVETIRAAEYVLGNNRFEVRQRIGELRLSQIVDCSSGITGAHSDSYNVTLTVMTRLRQVDDGVVAETLVQGIGRKLTSGSDPVQCRSRGSLEQAISEALQRSVVAL